MKINYNASAILANDSLNYNDKRMGKSLEKLSSGYKLNKSRDGAASFAIARKLRAQLHGLEKATANAGNGISVIESVEGTLAEVQSMLQRLNELSIKASDGACADEDRKSIQAEVDQLTAEISRVAKDSEFSGQSLLDGNFDLKGYSNMEGVNVDYYSDETLAKPYKVEIISVGAYDADGNPTANAVINLSADFPPGAQVKSVGNEITITAPNNFEVKFTIDDNMTVPNPPISDTAAKTANTVTFDFNTGTSDRPGITAITNPPTSWDQGTWTPASGEYKFEVIKETEYTNGNVTNSPQIELSSDFPPDSVISYVGNRVLVTSASTGLNMEFEIDNTFAKTRTNDAVLDLTGKGSMRVQIGTREGQVLNIRIPEISLKKMGIDKLDMKTQEKAIKTIEMVKNANAYVLEIRSRLGAYQNRLEHTAASLEITSENVASAYSGLMDTNMAEEMTEYTKYQIMSQAGISMLSQANERPQKVLQLLQ